MFLSLLVLSGCCSSKKFSERTRTITITKIDTVLIIKTDTIPKVVTVLIHDTARIETVRVKTVSYYDTTLHKIVLKLQEKPFSVPLTIYKKEITNSNIKTVEKDADKSYFWIVVILCLIIIVLIKLKKFVS